MIGFQLNVVNPKITTASQKTLNKAINRKQQTQETEAKKKKKKNSRVISFGVRFHQEKLRTDWLTRWREFSVQRVTGCHKKKRINSGSFRRLFEIWSVVSTATR